MTFQLSTLDFRSTMRCCCSVRIGLFLLLLAIWIVLPTTSALAQGGPLPPFRVDPTLPKDIVVNANQGLGQCHWLSVSVLSLPHVSWGYDAGEKISGWATIEPQPGTFNWAPLDAEVNKARDLGKRIWLQLLTTEGQTPQWARDLGVVVVGSLGGTPVPWNETYQRLLRRAVHAMAARYDNDPTVDAINVMAGGCYGEMAICARETDAPAWEQAGYTDERYVAAVKTIIDIYLEEEYQWEDGTHSHGFRNKPVVLQLGSGLYGHAEAVIRPVVEYAVSKYGMRVWLKYNGMGGFYDMGWLFREYDTATRVGYEPLGVATAPPGGPQALVDKALEQHASYFCFQKAYFDNKDPRWQESLLHAARYLGAQIVSQGVEAPAQVSPGEEFVLVSTWVNRGTAPLMRPERQGIKDVPASYHIEVAFVDPASGATVFEHTFAPAVPTTNWYTAQPVRIESSIPVASSVPPGDYDLRIGLVNLNLPPTDEARYFRLANTALADGSGRYTVGRIAVRQQTVVPTRAITPLPSATPTPGQTSSWVSRLLRAIWEWLCRLLQQQLGRVLTDERFVVLLLPSDECIS